MGNKIWYAFLDVGGKSDDDDIAYYNNEDFPFSKVLEEHFEVIKEEIQKYIEVNEKNIKTYFNESLTTRKKSWRTFAFIKWNWKEKNNLRQCPETAKILAEIPNLVSASISIMEPNVQIKPHRGDTNAVVRAHLAIEIPESLPNCGFEVNNKKISWEEGSVFIFNDAGMHSAWNNTNKRRYVMLIDVVRPEFSSKKYQVCSMVLGGLVMQSIILKIPKIQDLPKLFLFTILYAHVGLINLVLRFRKVFNL